ncbi:MAG: TonB-dependent receptor, partial [candidate division Zixibacteria bacterium]|nr:TonB-dependent receptor [candidate division Zixibacteria bacterium]
MHGRVAIGSTPSMEAGGRISGRIVDAVNGVSVAGASVVTVNGSGGTQADAEGRYLIDRLDAGEYSLRFSHVGYETRQVDGVRVRKNETLVLDIRLKKAPIGLKGMTVVPGRYAVMGSEPTIYQSLTRRDLTTLPQVGEDLYRAINRLPGITSNEYSARFNVRGGEYEQLLVTLDGLQLYEPFHLKDVEGGALSIIDAAAVDGIELITGGFGAEYGDRMSGVLSIRSRRPPVNRRRFSFGISVMNVRAMLEGTFNDN